MDNKKRITVFAPSLEPGGAERVIVNLVNGFIDKSIDVDLIIATKYKTLRDKVNDKVAIIELDYSRTIFSIFSLIKYLKKTEPIAILSHISRANRIAIIANILIGKKHKVYVVEHTTHSAAMMRYNFITKYIKKLIYKYLYPTADMIIHVSKEAAEDLEKQYEWKKGTIKVAYNPIVDEELVNKQENGIIHKWFEQDQPPVILGVGRLIADKNFSFLIDAFSLVRKSINARLIILGEGPEKILLKNKLSTMELEAHVFLPGYVDNPYDYMKHASVFVLSSRREGLPTVLIEALACGCPIVSTNCRSGPSEILENGKYGELVPYDDVNKMADAIIKTIQNPADPELLIERARHFTIENSVNQYLNLLNINPNNIRSENRNHSIVNEKK